MIDPAVSFLQLPVRASSVSVALAAEDVERAERLGE